MISTVLGLGCREYRSSDNEQCRKTYIVALMGAHFGLSPQVFRTVLSGHGDHHAVCGAYGEYALSLLSLHVTYNEIKWNIRSDLQKIAHKDCTLSNNWCRDKWLQFVTKIRICIDPVNLNKRMKREHYAMHTVEEFVSSMPGS